MNRNKMLSMICTMIINSYHAIQKLPVNRQRAPKIDSPICKDQVHSLPEIDNKQNRTFLLFTDF